MALGSPPLSVAAIAGTVTLACLLLDHDPPGGDRKGRTVAALNKAVVDAVADGVVGIDCGGRITFVNPAAESLSGWSECDVIGKGWGDIFGLDIVLPAHPGQPSRTETTLPRRGGAAIPVEIHLSPIVERRTVTGHLMVLHDIRERRRAEANRKLAAAILEGSSQPVVVTDPSGVIVIANPAFARLSGYTPEEVVGQPASMLGSDRHDRDFHASISAALANTGSWRGEMWNHRPNGSLYAVWVNIATIAAEPGGAGYLVAFYFDITERKRHEERLVEAANHDALTGLPNRRMFERILTATMEQTSRDGLTAAILLIDLDGFKAVNDTYGHDAGDALLQALAGRMKGTVRAGDMAARLGGDEFAVLLRQAEGRTGAARAAESLVERLSQPVPFGQISLKVSASIGVALIRPGDNPPEMLKAADRAMYAVKRGGKHGFRFHDHDQADNKETET